MIWFGWIDSLKLDRQLEAAHDGRNELFPYFTSSYPLIHWHVILSLYWAFLCKMLSWVSCELSTIVMTPVQGKTRMSSIKRLRCLLLDVIMNIAVVIYSQHLSRWRCRGLTLLSFLKGMGQIPVYVHANHSWSSFIYRRSEYKVFYWSLQIAFPNNVLVSMFRG